MKIDELKAGKGIRQRKGGDSMIKDQYERRPWELMTTQNSTRPADNRAVWVNVPEERE